MATNNNLTVIIMAAGQGKRMKSSLPKVLHKFNGVPFLVRIVRESQKLCPNKIIIVVGKEEDLIKNTLLECGISSTKVIFVHQPVANGTGGAVRCALDFVETQDNVLILNGDMPLITSELLANVHAPIVLERNVVGRLVIAELDDPQHYGRIIKHDDKFVGIIEYKDCDQKEKNVKLVNAGVYYFNGSILKKYIDQISDNNAQHEYYLTDIIQILAPKYEIETYLIDTTFNYQILGINTREELEELEERYKDK